MNVLSLVLAELHMMREIAGDIKMIIIDKIVDKEEELCGIGTVNNVKIRVMRDFFFFKFITCFFKFYMTIL